MAPQVSPASSQALGCCVCLFSTHDLFCEMWCWACRWAGVDPDPQWAWVEQGEDQGRTVGFRAPRLTPAGAGIPAGSLPRGEAAWLDSFP